MKAYANLGLIYYKGLGDIKKDPARGQELIQQGADKGHGRAMYFLGTILMGEENWEEALEWLQKAQGNSEFMAAINEDARAQLKNCIACCQQASQPTTSSSAASTRRP